MSSGTLKEKATPLVVELWYAEAPDLGDPWLLQALRSQWPATELQMESIVVPHGDPPSPLLTVIMTASSLGEGGKALPDVSQTWNWEGAEAAVSASRCSVLVTEMFGDGRTPQERWDAMGGVVAEMARLTRPIALSWPQSQRVGDRSCLPQVILMASSTCDISASRMIRGDGDGHPRAACSGSLTQCHFRDRGRRDRRDAPPQPSTCSGPAMSSPMATPSPGRGTTTAGLVSASTSGPLAPADRSSMSILVSRTRTGHAPIGA